MERKNYLDDPKQHSKISNAQNHYNPQQQRQEMDAIKRAMSLHLIVSAINGTAVATAIAIIAYLLQRDSTEEFDSILATIVSAIIFLILFMPFVVLPITARKRIQKANSGRPTLVVLHAIIGALALPIGPILSISMIIIVIIWGYHDARHDGSEDYKCGTPAKVTIAITSLIAAAASIFACYVLYMMSVGRA
ncbi:hypothetical protein [Paramagnetospirillum magneticum]|uniref:hypothetical protein n=1 Tax=Paramagnetospirillum magneticum TaxID=84159 RepID=UPI0011D16F7A|nr:hypothetical protein [Paramagnetospirillum magneticum]